MELAEQSLELIHLPEPRLEFGYRQTCAHPKDGLFLYGPHNRPAKMREIRIGVIGTPAGITHFGSWAERIKKRVGVPPPGKTDKKNRLHLANFPGIEEAFGISFTPKEFSSYPIDPKAIGDVTRIVNHHEAVKKAVSIYMEKAQRHGHSEEQDIDLWVLVLPEIIFERCTPKARRTGLPLTKGDFGRRQKARADLPLLGNVIDQSAGVIFDDFPDFHRQVKAAFLKVGKTSQLLRETTLAPEAFKNKAGYPERRVQDPATIAWNLATGLYYKTQPMPPWKLASVRPGVCYVGLVYKLIPNHPQDHVCCAAQMFLSEGDGVVFRGTDGPWKTGDFEYHLKETEATNLISNVLETYRDKHGGAPKELFIHGRTNFNDEEWKAFEKAVPAETDLVGIRIRTTDGETKLFRDGDYPALRGTAMMLDDRNAYLWTNGYIPELDTYIGPETPNPLFITILRSKGDKMPKLARVLTDIVGLTKINYNSCNYNDGLPVTVRFANMVGDVLTMGSAKDAQRQPFKYYV